MEEFIAYNNDLIHRLKKRSEIRRQISTRKSVQEGQPDRLADLLDEAADAIHELKGYIELQIRMDEQKDS